MKHGNDLNSVATLAIEDSVGEPREQSPAESEAHRAMALRMTGDAVYGSIEGQLEIR